MFTYYNRQKLLSRITVLISGHERYPDPQGRELRAPAILLDAELGSETSSCSALELRQVATSGIGLSQVNEPPTSEGINGQPDDVTQQERFLNAEIIAIYW